jgi:hypothetical protein
MECGYETIPGRRINGWLVSEGYMAAITVDGKSYMEPTENGRVLGIMQKDRTYNGENVKMNLYAKEAQKYIASNALKILNFKNQA